jgi:hypothetical protein
MPRDRRVFEVLLVGTTIAAGSCTFVFVEWLKGPSRCVDGWASRSIGIQGACSFHGGVDTSWGLLPLFSAAIVAWGVFWALGSRLFAQFEEQERATQAADIARLKAQALEDGNACTECGFPMFRRTTKNGPSRGSYYMRCCTYPKCQGKRPLTEAEMARWGIGIARKAARKN